MPYIPLSQIDEWEHNKELRGSTRRGDAELEENLSVGQHTTLLVKANGDRYIALGGNHRKNKMLTMGYTEADCTILTWGQDGEGYYPIFNNRAFLRDGKALKHFQTIDEGEYYLAFSHNSRHAFWQKDGVINAVGNFPSLPVDKIGVDWKEPLNLKGWMDKVKNPPEQKEKEIEIACPSCAVVFMYKIDGKKSK